MLLATGLSSCASQAERYCSALKSDQHRLARLTSESGRSGSAGSTALKQTVSVLSDLGDKAPDNISDDWTTLVDALSGLVDAIRESGADPADFQGGKNPAGVTQGELHAVQEAAAERQATPVQQASQSIEQHASDVCKVDLGSRLGTGG